MRIPSKTCENISLRKPAISVFYRRMQALERDLDGLYIGPSLVDGLSR